VPNGVLITKTSNQLLGPVTINSPGSFTIQVQNGSGTTLSNGATLTVNPATPSISIISPTTVTAGTFSLTINGSNFNTSNAQIVLTGPNCPTATSCVVPNNVLTTKTSNQLVGPLTINAAGSFTIRVQNGAGGTLSNGATLTVQSLPAPSITAISPSAPQVGGIDQNVLVIGDNFDQNLTVTVNFPNGGSTILSGTQIQSVTKTSFVMRITFGSPGTWGIQVNSADGKSSNVFTFTVASSTQAPTISSISPTVPIATGSDQNVSVYGSNFLPNFTVSVSFPGGGSTSLSGTQIGNVTPSSFNMRITLGVTGVWSVRVINPDGKQSSIFNFNVISSTVVPSISKIAPTALAMNGAGASVTNSNLVTVNAQTLTVSGNNFQPALTIEMLFPTGQNITLQGPTQVQNVSSSSFVINFGLPASGDYTIRVKNPDGGQSNPFTFNVPASTPGTCSINLATRFSQIEGGWENDVFDHDDCTINSACRIKNWGCYMTSLAMALKFNGIDTDPRRLNEFMTSSKPSGYTQDGMAQNLPVIVKSLSSGTLTYIEPLRTSNPQTIKDILCNGFPLIVGVNPSFDDKGHIRYGHFVLVTGVQGNTFTIADPMQRINESRTLDFYFKTAFPTNWFQTRGYVAPLNISSSALTSDNQRLALTTSTENTTVSFSVGHNAEMLLIDPVGRRTGYDPITKVILQEIPNSVYSRDTLNEDETGTPGVETTRSLNLSQPVPGSYQLIVTAQGSGTAEVSITSSGADGSAQPTVSIVSVTQTASTSTYQINVAPTVTTSPILIAEENSSTGIALDSVTLTRDPFAVNTLRNFSTDHRTRVMLFAKNVNLQPGETSAVVTAVGTDIQHNTYPLPVEAVMKVPNLDGFTQIVVKLPDALAGKGDVRVGISVRGIPSQQVTVRIQ
jgi:hypothetical protein